MTKQLTVEETAARLMEMDNILILTHKLPDGDTIGSALALTETLRAKGKRVRATWTGELSSCYSVLTGVYEDDLFEPDYIVSVDIAGVHLLPDDTKPLGDKIDLAIDHHGTNAGFAKETLVDATSASCCEIIYQIIQQLNVEITPYIGNCLYVGLSTDTGCFKFNNTTPASHLLAAKLDELGVDIARLNQLFFEQKSRARIEIERRVLNGMEFTANGQICLITITREMMEQTRCLESDIEGVAAIPKSVEGVEAGVTLRERPNGSWKISVRTKSLDASKICALFGGGGHKYAAGCECTGDAYDVKVALCRAIQEEMTE